MPEQIPFIGREDELTQIEQLIREWETRRVLCIHGPGGIGKTRLLEEAHRRYIGDEGTPVLVADIIDFDDRTLHVPENVELQIMQRLTGEEFEPYLRSLLDWRKMQAAGVSAGALEQQDERVRQALVDNFNQVSSERRVVLLLDTIEKVKGIEVWNRLGDLILASKNALFLLAGRRAKDLWASLHPQLGEDAQLIELQPLEARAGRQYLEQKQRQLYITLEPDLANKLLLLAQGRPILIDLAVEWLARDLPLDWLTESSQEELESLTPTDMVQRQKDFEIQLVSHITQIRTPMDRLTLIMSRVYPLDVEMIVELLKLSKDEAGTLFKEAQTYVFVKSLPDGRISLHDEVRRMVGDYVWPEVDSDGDRQRHDSRLAAEYLGRKVRVLTQEIKQLAAAQETAHRKGNAQAELNAFTARETSERKLWALKEQQLFHTLFTDLEAGVKTFAEIFDEATRAYHFSFRETLLAQMQTYVGELSPTQKYEVDIRRAKYLLDAGQYSEARELLVGISGATGFRPGQQVDTFIQLANVEIRLGKFQEGIRFFKKAVQISQKYKLKEWLAKAETGLGWAYRLIADLKEAGKHYEAALDLAIEIGLKYQQAILYGNLGFVYAYYAHIPGHREKALWFCEQSLSLWEELGDRRGQGRAYSTLGSISLMAGQFDEALLYFQKALNIFEPANDREWLSTVYSWRGAVYLSMDNFELAEKDLLRSRKLKVQKDRPINLSRLGQLYMRQGKLDEAQEVIEECHELALAMPDVWYQLVSLRDMAGLSLLKREYERLEEFEQRLDSYLEKWEAQDRRALGMLYLNLGSLALGQSDLAKAVEHFEAGLKLLAELGRYGNDTPHTYMERLEKIIVMNLRLPPEQIRDIGSKLLSFWREEGLHITHPDVRILLSRWAKWEGT